MAFFNQSFVLEHLVKKDIVIPIVFPDYLITVSTSDIDIDIPDIIPFVDLFPDHVRIPGTKNKVPELGHAGVLFINGQTGVTKYYEYGRYDKASLGLTRRIRLLDVRIGRDNKPTQGSLSMVLAQISRQAGQNGRIEGAYIEVASGKYASMLQYCTRRVSLNSNPNREPYSLARNSCMHFSKSVVESAGVRLPWIVDPRPSSFISEVQGSFPRLTFVQPSTLFIET